MSNKPEITRLSLHADVLNITINIEIVDGSPEENITITLPRTSEGRREAIEFVDDWRAISKRRRNPIGVQTSTDVRLELEALEITGA